MLVGPVKKTREDFFWIGEDPEVGGDKRSGGGMGGWDIAPKI